MTTFNFDDLTPEVRELIERDLAMNMAVNYFSTLTGIEDVEDWHTAPQKQAPQLRRGVGLVQLDLPYVRARIASRSGLQPGPACAEIYERGDETPVYAEYFPPTRENMAMILDTMERILIRLGAIRMEGDDG